MSAVERQKHFMKALFEAPSAPNRRQKLLQHANSDQINAFSELVLNALKNNVPFTFSMKAQLRRYKNPLREIGKRRNPKATRISYETNRERILA